MGVFISRLTFDETSGITLRIFCIRFLLWVFSSKNCVQIEDFKRFASREDVFESICSKIAPSIFGEENVKKAVACLLFGGARKVYLAHRSFKM